MSETWDVLVVDDEPVVCDAIRLVLSREGWRVAVVHDLDAALAHPALATCRLVFCDLMLPGRSGFEAVRAMRRRRPELPIVVVTGYATAENAAQALALGATDFLAKPFDDEELSNRTRHALARVDVTEQGGTP
jgi:DNA-binding response OmpR family regulator